MEDLTNRCLKDICEKSLGDKVAHKKLYERMCTWFQENNLKYPLKSHHLIKEMRQRGYRDKRGSNNLLFWLDVALLTPVPKEPGTSTP